MSIVAALRAFLVEPGRRTRIGLAHVELAVLDLERARVVELAALLVCARQDGSADARTVNVRAEARLVRSVGLAHPEAEVGVLEEIVPLLDLRDRALAFWVDEGRVDQPANRISFAAGLRQSSSALARTSHREGRARRRHP